MLGDHQRDFTALVIALIGLFDEAHTVPGIEGTRRLIVDIAEVAQFSLRILCRRLYGFCPRGASVIFVTHTLKLFHGITAQGIDEARGKEPRLAQFEFDGLREEERVAELAELLA